MKGHGRYSVAEARNIFIKLYKEQNWVLGSYFKNIKSYLSFHSVNEESRQQTYH